MKKEFLRKIPAIALAVAVASGTVVANAGQDFYIYKCGRQSCYSDLYRKIVNTSTARVKVTKADLPSYKTVLRVYDKYNDKPATATLNINNDDRNNHYMAYYNASSSNNERKCDYKSIAFSAYLKGHPKDFKGGEGTYVIVNWNPNG